MIQLVIVNSDHQSIDANIPHDDNIDNNKSDSKGDNKTKNETTTPTPTLINTFHSLGDLQLSIELEGNGNV
jgi:hypothetical protein